MVMSYIGSEKHLALLINIFVFQMGFSNVVFAWCWPPSGHRGLISNFKERAVQQSYFKCIHETPSTAALVVFSQNIGAVPSRSLSQEMLPH